MYTTMHAFHCSLTEKHYINCVHNRIFPKMGGGGPNALLLPSTFFGGPWPPALLVADPINIKYTPNCCQEADTVTALHLRNQ